MAIITPTIKTCNEICRLITGSDCNQYRKYVLPVFDPVSTHALYGVRKSEVDTYKIKIKSIGGKYIRVVSSHNRSNDYRVICFVLEITPQEELKVKMEKEKKERYQKAWDSKFAEIEASILLPNAGATNISGKKNFCTYLLNGDLDPLLPFESYVFIDQPTDKDEKCIFDIIEKANCGYIGCVGMVTLNRSEMVELAIQMNKSITSEYKRMRRRAACLKYGLIFLAKCFEKAGCEVNKAAVI